MPHIYESHAQKHTRTHTRTHFEKQHASLPFKDGSEMHVSEGRQIQFLPLVIQTAQLLHQVLDQVAGSAREAGQFLEQGKQAAHLQLGRGRRSGFVLKRSMANI